MARSRGAALAIVGLLVALVAGGCELLFPGGGFGSDFPEPSQIASFSSGTATVAITGGETFELTDLDRTSGIESVMGSDVRWSNDDGWSLRVSGAGATLPDGMELGGSAFLTLDRISDGRHWTTLDPSRCIVTVDVADKTGVRGSAICRGVEWYDALDGVSLEPPSKADQPKFDADITFEATP